MSQPTEPTRPATPRGPGDPASGSGRRVSDSRHTFPQDAPAPPTAPPPAPRTPAEATGTGSSAGAPRGSYDGGSTAGGGPTAVCSGSPGAASPHSAGPGGSGSGGYGSDSDESARSRPPIVPQIGATAGSQANAHTVGSNPYGPAGARYVSDSPPPAAGLATGAIPRVAEAPYEPPQQGGNPGQSAAPAAAGAASVAPGQQPNPGAGPVTGPLPMAHQAHYAGSAQQGGSQPGSTQLSGDGQAAAYTAEGVPTQPAKKNRRRGPGWAALVVAALLAAIVGGALGGGGAWLLSGDASPIASQQSEDTPQQSDRTISQSTETPDWAQIADQATPGVAAIQVAVDGEVAGLGSGFVYDDQGHVVTNNHVVAPADTDGGEVQVVLSDGSMIGATLVGRDPETDVAVLQLDSLPEDLTPLPIGASEDLFVGDPVMALGNPLGLADTVTTGIVSALDRPVTTENIGDVSEQEVAMTITNAIQTDAAINPGNSGGPLVNGNGEVVGINSSAATLSDPASSEAQSGSIGIGFAITVEQATTIADQLIDTGEAKHPLLGVTMVNSTVDAQGVTRGSARVTAVEDGTPAAAAGFREDDEIIAVGGKPVNSGVSLQALVRSSVSGEPVEFTVVRGGREETLSAALDMR